MNRAQLVAQIAASHQAARSSEQENQQKEEKEDQTLAHIADMLDSLSEVLTRNTQRVRIQNWQKKVSLASPVQLKELDELTSRLDSLEDEVQDRIDALGDRIEKKLDSTLTVHVDNPTEATEFPEIEIPEKVTATIEELPKYVQDLLSDIKKAINGLKLSPTIDVRPEAPVVTVDTTAIVEHLDTLKKALESLLQKEPVTVEAPNFTGLEDKLFELSGLLNQIQENTSVQTSQTFRSSWDKSLHMQSLDAAATTSYHTINTPDALDGVTTRRAIEYIQFIDDKGVTWRKTYTQNTYGETVSWTDWTQV